METHPSKLAEDIIAALIPPACREHVLGDLYERYTSPSQYVLDALTTLPFVIASQVRRTFDLKLFVAEAVTFYIAFGGASLVAGPGYLYDSGALFPLAIVISTLLFTLRLCDAYTYPRTPSFRARRFHIVTMLTCTFIVQALIGLVNPHLTLPAWIMLAGSAAAIPMLLMLRNMFRRTRDDLAMPGGGKASGDGLRRRSSEEYRRAWRVNWIWLIAAFAVVFITPKIQPQGTWLEIVSGILLIAIICLTAWRGKRGQVGTAEWYTSLSISEDPYRKQLDRKRDGLLFWAGGGMFSLLPGAGPTVILFLIAFPLLMFFIRWVLGLPYPPNVTPTRVWVVFIAFGSLCAAWAFVRSINLRAARAMREELESLDSSEKKQ